MVRAPAASVLLAGVLVSACGAERARAPADRVPAPAGTTRYVDERRGFEVTFPSAWRRARRVLTPALWEPREILSVGTVRPVANGPASRCAQHPTAAMGRFAYPRPWRIYPFRLTGVQLHHQIALGTFALEQGRPDPNCTPATALRARERDGGLLFAFEYAGLSEAQKRRFPLRPARFRLNPRDPVAYECLGHSSLIRWREAASGRVFQAHLYGPRRWVQQALGILDSFEISRQGR